MVSESAANLRRNLREIAEQRHFSSAVGDYLDSYFVDVELTDAGEASPEALLGAALQHFRLGEARPAAGAAVALYTPDFDRHGWHSPHTVIDVVTDDMLAGLSPIDDIRATAGYRRDAAAELLRRTLVQLCEARS